MNILMPAQKRGLFFIYLLNYMNDNILSSVVVQIIYRYKDELIMEIKEKTNEKAPEKIVNKTTETLVKELETMSDTGLHDLFMFFYRLNCNHGNMIYNDKFNEFLEAFTSNPFRHHEDKTFRKELILDIFYLILFLQVNLQKFLFYFLLLYFSYYPPIIAS